MSASRRFSTDPDRDSYQPHEQPYDKPHDGPSREPERDRFFNDPPVGDPRPAQPPVRDPTPSIPV
jgi:hypothetical protein